MKRYDWRAENVKILRARENKEALVSIYEFCGAAFLMFLAVFAII